MSDEIFEKLIKAEGGYVYTQIENDKGGKTFAGISQRSNPDWEGWNKLKYVKANKKVDEVLIATLRPLVKELYRVRYWNAAHLNDKIFDEFDETNELNDLKNMIFHISVLSGPKIAIYCLQNSLGEIEADGLWGPKTREKLGRELSLYANYNLEDENNNIECIQRGIALSIINRFVKICDNDRSQEKFLRGWIKRFLKLVG